MRCTVQHKTDKFMCPALISEKDHTCLKLKMVPYSYICIILCTYLKNRKSYLVVKGIVMIKVIVSFERVDLFSNHLLFRF